MASPVEIGEVLAGKFRVERVLGEGGMGVVVAATHLHLDQLVALKFMLPETRAHGEGTQRFLREAKATARLRNEHIARVLDVGTLDNGAPYIVSEFLEGRDLHGLIESSGRLPVADAVDYVLQACVGMAEAHAQGIIHRDLKPQNLFVTTAPDGRALIKVLDFGISKAPGASVEGLGQTRTGVVMGSPQFMSPEQMKSARDVDERADVWALGAILYYCLAGEVPFRAETFPELCAMVLSGEPPSMDAASLGAPPALIAVVQRCLAHDPEHRFANVAELAAALAPLSPQRGEAIATRVAALLGVTAVAPAVAPTQSPLAATQPPQPPARPAQVAPTTLSASAGEQQPVGAKRSPIVWIGAFAGVAVIAALAIAFSGSSDSSSAATAPAAAPASDAGDEATEVAAEPTPADPAAAPVEVAPQLPDAAPPPEAEAEPAVSDTSERARRTRRPRKRRSRDDEQPKQRSDEQPSDKRDYDPARHRN